MLNILCSSWKVHVSYIQIKHDFYMKTLLTGPSLWNLNTQTIIRYSLADGFTINDGRRCNAVCHLVTYAPTARSAVWFCTEVSDRTGLTRFKSIKRKISFQTSLCNMIPKYDYICPEFIALSPWRYNVRTYLFKTLSEFIIFI